MNKLNHSMKIRQLEIPNRLVMPPMATRSSEYGFVNPEIISYYEQRAAGKSVGLLITEHMYIDPQGKADPKQLGIDNDDKIQGLKDLTEAIHRAGQSKVFAQINHAGNMTKEEITGQQIVSSGNLPSPTGRSNEIPRALTIQEIHTLCDRYVDAAVRAKEAGYDGVEIHSAHGYLLDQFYSPLTNNRTDEYGGSLDNRIRLHLEVLCGIRRAVGSDYPIAIRLGGSDYKPGGATIEDAAYAAHEFEKNGADLIDISGGMCLYILPDRKYPGYFSDTSLAVKEAVKVPVLLTGGVTTGSQAEELLDQGVADCIGAGRVLMKDKGWAVNVLAE
jgi:NADPH2 dehydrogenase